MSPSLQAKMLRVLPGSTLRKSGQQRNDPNPGPHFDRHQSRPGTARGRGKIPQRPLLSAQRGHYSQCRLCVSVWTTCPSWLTIFCSALTANWACACSVRAGIPGLLQDLLLARQRPRTSKCDQAGHAQRVGAYSAAGISSENLRRGNSPLEPASPKSSEADIFAFVESLLGRGERTFTPKCSNAWTVPCSYTC